MILAPAQMAAHSDPKVAAAKCFEEIALDPDNYRIGHTKASWRTLDKNEVWQFHHLVVSKLVD